MNLRIASPCKMSWDAMPGDERVRHCSLCDLNVYNVAEMTRDEVRELLRKTEGRLCARIDRRAEMTVFRRVAAAMVAALFSVSAFAFPHVWTGGSKVKLSIERAASAQKAVFNGTVRASESPLPGATVIVRSESTTFQYTTVTDMNGNFTIASLDDGVYRVDVSLRGFVPAVIKHMKMKANEVTNANVVLRIDENQPVILGAIAP